MFIILNWKALWRRVRGRLDQLVGDLHEYLRAHFYFFLRIDAINGLHENVLDVQLPVIHHIKTEKQSDLKGLLY